MSEFHLTGGRVSVVPVKWRSVTLSLVTAEQLLSTEVRYVDADGQEVVTALRKVDPARLARALPVRRTLSRAGQRHYSGLFWSATTRGHVPYESRLELDRLWLADFDPDVTWVAAQPLWFAGRDGDKVRRHAPDLLLTTRDGGICLVDVKPAVFADLPEVAAVFDWTSRLCRARDWKFEVWTGGDPVVLANIRALAVARRWALPELRMTGAGTTMTKLGQTWSGRRSVDLSTPLSAAALMEAGSN